MLVENRFFGLWWAHVCYAAANSDSGQQTIAKSSDVRGTLSRVPRRVSPARRTGKSRSHYADEPPDAAHIF